MLAGLVFVPALIATAVVNWRKAHGDNAWSEFMPFLDYSPKIRRVLHTRPTSELTTVAISSKRTRSSVEQTMR